jgi:formyltetrahydrofolate deformylase
MTNTLMFEHHHPADTFMAKHLVLLRSRRMALHTSRLGTLRVFGPDSFGIVAACSNVLGKFGCNIVKSETWSDRKEDMFFQRIAFSHDSPDKVGCQQEISDICNKFQLESRLNFRDRKKKVGIMVSKFDHCLWELLLRHSAQELDMDIEVVISNHSDLQSVAETFQVPFHVTSITSETKEEQEAKQLELLKDVDVVVLARYMQVLSGNFLNHFPDNIINIHHSFLPAFKGGSPYHAAWDRGVKLIGATAHYASLDLDEGPIIEQDVINVSHRDEVNDMLRKGRILERNVLLKALEAHLDDRVIVYKNRCVVFGD